MKKCATLTQVFTKEQVNCIKFKETATKGNSFRLQNNYIFSIDCIFPASYQTNFQGQFAKSSILKIKKSPFIITG